MTTTADILALADETLDRLQARADAQRLGKSLARETDADILALRAGAEALRAVRALLPDLATDDEREAIARTLWEAEVAHNPEGVTEGVDSWDALTADEPEWADGYRYQADRVMASPEWRNRHRGPITDEAIERAASGMWDRHGAAGMFPHAPEHMRRAFLLDARAALEAAEAAHAEAPSFTARVYAAARLLCPHSTEERRDPCGQCLGRTTAMLRAADRV